MEESESSLPKADVSKFRLLRCMDWLQKQNSEDPKKLSLQNKNDIQFIIETNADRKRFLLSVADDEATVPPGVDEPTIDPKDVPVRNLRTKDLHMECEWQGCGWTFTDYDHLQRHVKEHYKDLHIINNDDAEYVCMWDVCGHKTSDHRAMIRHINYHAYHSRLMAIGLNARATLKLARCKKDSSKRNQLPPLKTDHCCMWTGCDAKFDSIQTFFDHVQMHVAYSEGNLCSWAGCGATFNKSALLGMHARSHTRERLVACYHCGAHFVNNRTLGDHLKRQNVFNSKYSCNVCGAWCASPYLLREHARQHINAYACALCDMSAPSPAALAQHVRYRHLAAAADWPSARPHQCHHCQYRAVTKSDLNKHIPTHSRKKKQLKEVKRELGVTDSEVSSDEEHSDNSDGAVKKERAVRKYACHMCPEKNMKVFQRGTRLTKHLRKMHGAQWPRGHSRFRYQISEDGMYRLTTTRYEFLDVSRKIVDGYSWPKESLNNTFEFDLELKSEATDRTPKRFEIKFKGDKTYASDSDEDKIKRGLIKKCESDENKIKRGLIDKCENRDENAGVEITVCDIDEHGNIINSEVIKTDVIHTESAYRNTGKNHSMTDVR